MTKTNIGFFTVYATIRGLSIARMYVHTRIWGYSKQGTCRGRQTGNKQTSRFNRIVPGAPRTRTHTQAERINWHANTAKGKPKLIVETLRKWSPGWYVFYRWRLNRIAIFIILREIEGKRETPILTSVPLSCPRESDESCPRERVQVSVFMCAFMCVCVCVSPEILSLYTPLPPSLC